MRVGDIREHFIKELAAENFTVDKTGAKTIEYIGASFIADEPSIFGEPNEDYIAKELKWYDSESTNINDIYEDKKPPAAWMYAANKHGEINSNYGHLVFGSKYFCQASHAIAELRANPDTRRAIMVYNRPSIWTEYNENGKSDFICTNAATYYIRDNKVHVVVQMRSNDVVFGYKNDYAWAKNMLEYVTAQLHDPKLLVGDIHWQVQNLHTYERHFGLVK